MDDILVSINCLAYNHENYIADAIESFLMQKTSFKFEILIHDDASTDRTADIVRKYEKKYPDFIKPIYQSENQYSKGIRVGFLNRKRAKGKYIAVCEGDDYWTDPYKLQMQVDYMESYPDCSMCFHDAILVDVDKTYLGLFPGYYSRSSDGIKDIAQLVFIPTASKMYRKSLLDLENIPDWYYKAPYGDFSSMLICSNYGYIYYINKKMSAYRTNVPGSILYSQRKILEKNPKMGIRKSTERSLSRIRELNNYNKWSNYKNDESVQKLIIEEEFRMYYSECNVKELRKEKYKVILKRMKPYQLLIFYLRPFIPLRVRIKINGILKSFRNAFYRKY